MPRSIAVLLCLLVGFVESASSRSGASGSPGKIVFSSDRGANSIDLWVVNADGKGLLRLTRRTGSDFVPKWSPRGDRVVFHAYGPPTANGEIYVIGANGRGLRRLTNNRVEDVYPTWSPDGRKILFVSHPRARGKSDLFVMRSDGTGRRRLRRTNACEGTPDWSPDGKWIVVASGCTSVRRIVVMRADGSRPRVLARGVAPVWSPDGRRIAFTKADTPTGYSIRIVNGDGSGAQRLPFEAGRDGLSWSPDGQMLAFSKTEMSGCTAKAVDLIYVASIAGGAPTRVTQDPCTDGDDSPDWHP